MGGGPDRRSKHRIGDQFAFSPNWRLKSFCFQWVSILTRTSMLAEKEATSSTEIW